MSDNVIRTIKVPLEKLSSEQWKELRAFAFISASFCNEYLNAHYVKAKGVAQVEKAEAPNAYRDYAARLSSAVRDALTREVQGMWRRNGKLMLSGGQTLGRFTTDRALAIRADKGAVKFARSQDSFEIALPLAPPKAGAPIIVTVWGPALAKDWYLRSTLDAITAGTYRLAKVTVRFEPRGGKVMLLVTYEKPAEAVAAGSREAEFVCDEEYWLRCGQRALSFGNQIYRLVEMKEHFAAIQRRLRIQLGKAGKRRGFRRTLANRRSYAEWAEGPLHQLSRDLVKWCQAQNAGRLALSVTSLAADINWSRLQFMLDYKCREAGIDFEVSVKSAAAEGRTIERAAREIQKDNVRDLRKLKENVKNVLQGDEDGKGKRQRRAS